MKNKVQRFRLDSIGNISLLKLFIVFVLVAVGAIIGSTLLNFLPREVEIKFREVLYPRPDRLDKNTADYYVITQGNWKKFYSSIPSSMDLGNNVYVGVSRDGFNTGGYSVAISEITRIGNEYRVQVIFEDPDGAVIQMPTWPYTLVEIHKRDLPLPTSAVFRFIDPSDKLLKSLTIRFE